MTFINLHRMMYDLKNEFPAWAITFKKVTKEEDCPTKRNGRKEKIDILIPVISDNGTQIIEVRP